MRLVTWNVNHRTTQKPIPPGMAAAITLLAPDVLVLTEYVAGPSRDGFLAELASSGLKHVRVSVRQEGQNQVLIASRTPLEDGDIPVPAVALPLASNVLHMRLPADGMEVLGLRVPAYKVAANKRTCWDWILNTAAAVRGRPFVLLGDFNTATTYSRSRCGDRIEMLNRGGWKHAAPSSGASYWGPTDHGVAIDHAFVSDHFHVQGAWYVAASGPYIFAGKGGGALSDHAALIVDLSRAPTNVSETGVRPG